MVIKEIRFLFVGIVMLVLSVVYFLGKTDFLQKKFRDVPYAKTYMRRVGISHLVIGLEGIFLAFQESTFLMEN